MKKRSTTGGADPRELEAINERIDGLVEAASDRLNKLEDVSGVLGRQMMMQQLFVEERIRSDGQSGLKQVRQRNTGIKSYHQQAYAAGGIASIHEHANNIRTVGMGEFIGVLNGVEFRTRHNDYRLYQPSMSSGEFHETEDIEFPPVPPAVTDLVDDIDAQILEMREWFKAWANQDYSVRDYRPYFQPVISYLEGAWLDPEESLESFFSDRHFIDAKSWFDLQEKIRYTSYSGSKSQAENLAFLPVTLIEMGNDTLPKFAQWNYRILGHKLQRDLPTDRLILADDFMARLRMLDNMEEFGESRAARFRVNPKDQSVPYDRVAGRSTLLDELMFEIPGKDNYPGWLNDTSLDGGVAIKADEDITLNAARYHRMYRTVDNDAMGVAFQRRSFADDSVFFAKTSQDNVAQMSLNLCPDDEEPNEACILRSRWSFAVPMEIIYLTPLSSWNPYNLEMKDGNDADGRNGGLTADTAFDGIGSTSYYITPNGFYNDAGANEDPADTDLGAVGVLDPEGNVRQVRSAGTRIALQPIPGIGRLRTRYPIMPLVDEGSTTFQEMEAMRDLVHESSKYLDMYRTTPAWDTEATPPPPHGDIVLVTNPATRNPPGPHVHNIELTSDEVTDIQGGATITVTSTEASGHSHDIAVAWDTEQSKYVIWSCDSKIACWDGHSEINENN